MEKNNNNLKMIWLAIPLALAAGLAAFSRVGSLTQSQSYIFYLIFVLGICAWGYVSFRAIFFRGKLVRFIRKILDNDYQSGVSSRPGSCDEIVRLEKLVNKMADRLRGYDRLQMDRIFALTKAIDIIFNNAKDGVIIYAEDRKNFRINPAVQRIFGVEQENFTYDSLAGQEANRDFIARLKELVDQGKTFHQEGLELELPIRQSRRRLQLTMIPIKDRNEAVELAIIFAAL